MRNPESPSPEHIVEEEDIREAVVDLSTDDPMDLEVTYEDPGAAENTLETDRTIADALAASGEKAAKIGAGYTVEDNDIREAVVDLSTDALLDGIEDDKPYGSSGEELYAAHKKGAVFENIADNQPLPDDENPFNVIEIDLAEIKEDEDVVTSAQPLPDKEIDLAEIKEDEDVVTSAPPLPDKR
jgi:hypothetical protein